MKLKTVVLALLLLFTTQYLSAKVENKTGFLLKADETTSFMNYEFHNLAIEAATRGDYENTFRIYKKIAEKGDDRAEYNIGMMYMRVVGIKKAKMDAYKWLRRASRHGNKEAILFFKEMNERYDTKLQQTRSQKEKESLGKTSGNDLPTGLEKNTTALALEKVLKPAVKKTSQSPVNKKNEDNTPLFYIAISFVAILIILGGVIILRYSHKSSKTDSPQSGLKYKAQMYDITHERISRYHNELLKFFNIDKYKNDKKQMQKYYMFIGGMIDYFCKLEDFSDMEERRIFTTHMGNIEGKENVTAITQAILEGQRETSLYHSQAAGVISAKEWHETESTNAFLKLKQVLSKTGN